MVMGEGRSRRGASKSQGLGEWGEASMVWGGQHGTARPASLDRGGIIPTYPLPLSNAPLESFNQGTDKI